MVRRGFGVRRLFSISSCLSFAVLLLCSVQAQEPSAEAVRQAREQWMSGYLKVEAAGKALNEQRHVYALQLFREALGIFQNVRARYPDWNTDLINYRISYCVEQIRNLEAKTDVAAEELSRADLVRELSLLRDRRDRLETQNAELKTAAAILEKKNADLNDAVAERAALQEKLNTTTAELADADERLKNEQEARKQADENNKRLETRIRELTEQLETLTRREEELAGLEKQLAERRKQAEQLQTLKQQLQETDERLHKAQERIATLAEENNALAERAENAEAKTVELTGTVADLTKTAADLTDEKRKTQKKLEDVQAAADALAGKTESLKAQAEQAAALKSERDELRKTRDLLAEQRDAYGDKLAKLELEINDRDAKINALQGLVAGAGNDTLQARLREKDEALRTALRRIDELAQALARANRQTIGHERTPKTAPQMQDEARMQAAELLNQGVAALRDQAPETAVQLWTKALELDPDNLELLTRLGELQIQRGDDEAAIEALKKAYRLKPDSPDVLLSLGYSLLRRKDTVDAAAMLLQGVALKPDSAELRRYLGLAFSALGWTQAAENALRKALELNPEDADTAYNLAVLVATSDPARMEEARTLYERAVKLGAPRNPGLERIFKTETQPVAAP
jgi:Flp pilus assembly protein TadD/uncharacterized coiled-coil DUF342 family protein